MPVSSERKTVGKREREREKLYTFMYRSQSYVIVILLSLKVPTVQLEWLRNVKICGTSIVL
jgi:hypothetical protein